MFNELDIQIDNKEILTAIKQLKTGRSAGPDKMLNEFFINGKNELIDFIHPLFNKIFDTGFFPKEWSEGFIIPLHKKGNTDDVNNYRGITLLSTLGKLFTRILNNRLDNWAEHYFIYIEAQAGFRQNMGTIDNIFILHGIISHMNNMNKKLYCGFIDFSKAFDYVVRPNLWQKMIRYGIRGKMLSIIQSMYNSIKSRVKLNDMISNDFPCCLGVRQGECLSPLLFSLFLNDIEETMMLNSFSGIEMYMFKLFMLLYADDIILFSETADGLQRGFDILADYCNIWKLKVNVNKTKVMVFRKGGMLPKNLHFYYNNEGIEIVKQFSYLGVVFTPGGSFHEAQASLAGQSRKAIFKMNRLLFKFSDIGPKHRLELFDKLILPILNYGCEIWGFNTALQIERVHLKFCKSVLKVKQSTQNDFIYGELGRRTLITNRLFRIIKYWFKILESRENKYIKLIYDVLRTDIEIRPNLKKMGQSFTGSIMFVRI